LLKSKQQEIHNANAEQQKDLTLQTKITQHQNNMCKKSTAVISATKSFDSKKFGIISARIPCMIITLAPKPFKASSYEKNT
jgi:hypothetical protein